MNNRSALPGYVSDRDVGQSSVHPPGRFEGVTSYIFALEGSTDLMEAQARRHLTEATGGEWEASVFGPTVLLFFNYARRLTSPEGPSGWTPNYEAVVGYPVAMKQRGLLHPSHFFHWLPYVFIDNSRGMCTGRESWGYPKEIAQIGIPPLSSEATAWSVSPLIFRTFAPETEGRMETLIDVRRIDPPSAHESLWSETSGLCKWLVEQFVHGVRDAEILVDLVRDWHRGEMPVVNLKQFRDVSDGSRACYQALVTSPLAVRAMRQGGVLAGSYALRILPCDSHPIARQFGLATGPEGTIAIRGGAWVEWDFDAVSGDVLWEASRSGTPTA